MLDSSLYWMLAFAALANVLLGALAGASAARGVYTSLLHRIVSAESFLRSRSAAEARSAYRAREAERMEQWRQRSNAAYDGSLEAMARKIPERDECVPR